MGEPVRLPPAPAAHHAGQISMRGARTKGGRSRQPSRRSRTDGSRRDLRGDSHDIAPAIFAGSPPGATGADGTRTRDIPDSNQQLTDSKRAGFPASPLEAPNSPVYSPVQPTPLASDDSEPRGEPSLDITPSRFGNDVSNSSPPRESSNAAGVAKPTGEVTPKRMWLRRYRAALRVLRPDLTDQQMESTVGADRLYQALSGRFPTVPEQAAQFEAIYWMKNSRMRASSGPRPLGS
jgi:hypothetical protein